MVQRSFCFFYELLFGNNNLIDKALLILGSAPGHPTVLDSLVPNFLVVLLPPDTIALLQPMDQGVTTMFKAYHLCRYMQQSVYGMGNEGKPTVREFWKSLYIKKAVKKHQFIMEGSVC